MNALQKAAHAYSAGWALAGDRLLGEALQRYAPAIQRGIRSATPNQNHWEDAANEARIRIWRVVSRGALPAGVPEEALVVQLSRWAAIGILRRSIRHEAMSLDAIRDATVSGPDSDAPSPPPPLLLEDDPAIWHDIADLWTAGWQQRDMAFKLGVSPPAIRREINEMRKALTHRRAS